MRYAPMAPTLSISVVLMLTPDTPPCAFKNWNAYEPPQRRGVSRLAKAAFA
jgi:hypothetical protein